MNSLKVLDLSGLQYLWGKLKALIPTKVSDLTNDSGFISSTTAASTYVAQSQGAANSGKFLGINSSGNVTPTEIDASEAVIIEGTPREEEESDEYHTYCDINGAELYDAVINGKQIIIAVNWDDAWYDYFVLTTMSFYETNTPNDTIECSFYQYNGDNYQSLSYTYIDGQPSTTIESEILYSQVVDYSVILPQNISAYLDGTISGSGNYPNVYLEANVDLNLLIAVGLRKCLTSAIASSLNNCPTDEPFRLEIKNLGESNPYIPATIIQIINTITNKTYTRTKTNNTWSSWVAIPSPTAKTAAMTQAVGVDSDGTLWTTPSQSAAATIKVWTASDVEGE